MSARYVLGIDLGTTNSVLAYLPLEAEEPKVQLLPVPQLTAAGTVESRGALPSFVYLASEHEIGGKALDLPWSEGCDYAVGRDGSPGKRPRFRIARWELRNRGCVTDASTGAAMCCLGMRPMKLPRSRPSRLPNGIWSISSPPGSTLSQMRRSRISMWS